MDAVKITDVAKLPPPVVQITDGFSVGISCSGEDPCQHMVHITDAKINREWEVDKIVDFIVTHQFKIPLTEPYLACIIRPLLEQTPLGTIPTFWEFDELSASVHKCRAGHPLFLLKAACSNGWCCNGHEANCTLEQRHLSDGIDRRRCFACNYDVCPRCLWQVYRGWRYVDTRDVDSYSD